MINEVLVTGGGGYVGAALVPRLLDLGYRVKVLDLFMYEESVFDGVHNPDLSLIQGDIRDTSLLARTLPGSDAVIHLACISNDPSFELNPELGTTINYDAFGPLVRMSKESGVERFVYASSSSVYGVSDEPDVTEESPLRPLTDYSKFKALCEPLLLAEGGPDFTTVIVRPATICGYSPRQRLDLIVNLLTNHAVNNRVITVLGGTQLRPNIHIDDMVDLYCLLLEAPADRIAGKVFNVGTQNLSVAAIAEIVRSVVLEELPALEHIEIVTKPTNDQRSYHISSKKVSQELGFDPKHTVEDAVRDLVSAFRSGKLPNPMENARYYNIKTMQELGLN